MSDGKGGASVASSLVGRLNFDMQCIICWLILTSA